MIDNELKKLSRADLMQMVLVLTRENDALRAQVAETEKALQSRELQIAQAGSLAEAAAQVSGLFAAADEACRLYLENIQRRGREMEKQRYEKENPRISNG